MDGGRSILIAEDEPLISMMLEDFLDSSGHTVVATVDSVREAMARVAEGGFDLAILDVHLHGEEVWPVADRLADAGIPFLIASGGSVHPAPQAHAGAPQLAKPFTMDSVAQALARLD